MKANEITIGDWVMVNDVDHSDPLQVQGIYKKSGAYYAVLSDDLSADVDMIEPIILTREILEKNGFGYKEEDSYYIHFYQGERCYVANSDLHIGTNKKGVFWLNYYNNSIYRLRYVHELQHAFRLCGITREIIL